MRNPLPKILGWLTGTPRYVPEFSWENPFWVYKAARTYELIFGRRFGVRPAMTSYKKDGAEVYQAHSLEAALTLAEIWVRDLAKLKFNLPIKVWVPKFSSPEGLPSLSPYMFAIAFDAASDSGFTNPGPATQTQVITGSNPYLQTMSQSSSTGGATGITAIVYNAANLTKLFGRQNSLSAGDYLWVWYLANPSTGSHTLTTTTVVYVETVAASYTGVTSSSPIDTSGFNEVNGNGANTLSLTSGANNEYFVVGIQSPGTNSNPTSGTATLRVSGNPAGLQIMIYDQAAATAGSQSMTLTVAGGTGSSITLGALIKPAFTSSVLKVSGVPQASISKVSSVANASARKISGVQNQP